MLNLPRVSCSENGTQGQKKRTMQPLGHAQPKAALTLSRVHFDTL